MNAVAMTAASPASASAMPPRRVLGAYLAEARSECLRYLRAPGFMLPILLFPGLFYLVFGVLMGKSEGADAARYLLASYSIFGVMSPGLFGFGVSLAIEREGGLLTLKRALRRQAAVRGELRLRNQIAQLFRDLQIEAARVGGFVCHKLSWGGGALAWVRAVEASADCRSKRAARKRPNAAQRERCVQPGDFPNFPKIGLTTGPAAF